MFFTKRFSKLHLAQFPHVTAKSEQAVLEMTLDGSYMRIVMNHLKPNEVTEKWSFYKFVTNLSI